MLAILVDIKKRKHTKDYKTKINYQNNKQF